MEAAKGHQLRVPEDIAVVGFDGTPAAKMDRAVTNDRATTHCGEGALGRVGSSLLKEKGPLRLKLPAKVVIR
jgi:DNA-binding LacI/PurR family transcriptional regulator